MSIRQQFIDTATAEGANIAAVCRQFGISRTTGYKWLARYQPEDPASLADRSRRPHRSPSMSAPSVVAMLLALRQEHPAWAGRKLRRYLIEHGVAEELLPAPSTIGEILRRSAQIDPAESPKHRPMTRFEAAAPNLLWQIDFKGDFLLECARRCYPLTVLDDHSRFNLLIRSCGNMRTETVQRALCDVFRQYGLPERMLMDNGAPWGHDDRHRHTPLTVWLMRLGIAISHGRAYHPQTQGKIERFHRTLNEELIDLRRFADHLEAQQAFERWRQIYNHERPHEALKLAVPASRYQASPREFPETLPSIVYGPEYQVRKVIDKGKISFHGRRLHIGRGFIGMPIGLLPSAVDGLWDVYFCQFKVGELDLRSLPSV